MLGTQAGEMGCAKIQTLKKKQEAYNGMVGSHREETTRFVCTLEVFLCNRLNDRSRMKGDFHVRVCESLRGKFPWATLLSRIFMPHLNQSAYRTLIQAGDRCKFAPDSKQVFWCRCNDFIDVSEYANGVRPVKSAYSCKGTGTWL